MPDGSFLISDGRTLDGEPVDVAVREGRIDRVTAAGEADPGAFDEERRYDAGGRLVTPSLTEPHLHLDATLTAGEPEWNDAGTLAEGIRIWAKRKQSLEKAAVKDRAERAIEWFVANGVTRLRTHADTTESDLVGLEALLELREEVTDIADLQVVAFPQDGILTRPEHEDLLAEAAEMGADLIGAIPHNEHTREDGVKSVGVAADLAERHGLPLDLHIDETDDPNSRFTETLAKEALERGVGERTTASHTTAMHSYPDAYADKLISLIAESGISVITNPLANSVIQGRYDDYPRRRGHTRIDELRAAGVPVGIGHDCVMDPWYHYGRGDPLDSAFVLLHYAHMNGRADVPALWEMMTGTNAAVFGVDDADYGLVPGAAGSITVFDSPDGFNALRTRAERPLVLREGEPVARTEPATARVHRTDGPRPVDFHRE